MKALFYKVVIVLSKKMGPWVFTIFAWFVSTGYFLFFPSRVINSVRFYKELFPDRSRYYHIWCAWSQYHNFTHVFLDRILLQDFGNISYTSEGWKHIEDAVKNKTGGIILMSHIGNWEVAAHLLKGKLQKTRLLLYMGIKHKEQIEHIQKESLSQSGIRIIAVDRDGGSPFDLVEGVKLLKQGGLVSLTGDIIWNENQRVVPVKFLNHEVHLPEVPHILALLSGAPLFLFFPFRTGKNQYHFVISRPLFIKAASRSEKQEAIRKSAQQYADILEEALRRHPFEWHHFEPFLGRRLEQHGQTKS